MRYFGTDGVRGVANHYLSPELAFRLGMSAGLILKERGLAHTALIGRDTRLSSQMLQNALAAGFCSAGINVYDGGVITTPAVAYLARVIDGCLGAVVSASHNPAQDNGIKFISHEGYKLDDELLEDIEELMTKLPEPQFRPSGRGVGWIKPYAEGERLYLDYLVNSIDTRLDGLKVVVDCSNGAASTLGPQALRRAGAQVISIHDQPDGWNINRNCGSTHLHSLQEETIKWQADLGIAFDGDADRLMAVDHSGQEVDGDQILVIFALHLQSLGELDSPVVGTVMSNLGMKKALEEAGIGFLETQVGDRFVLQEMLEKGAILGGEQSGHIILKRKSTTGDGILSALHLMEALKKSSKTLMALAGMMQRYPQILVNATVATKDGWDTNPEIRIEIDRAEAVLADRGRLLVRPSGTEPLIRVMAEGPDEGEIKEIAERLAAVISEQQGY